MKQLKIENDLATLRRELLKGRQESIEATRRGDWRAVAALTTRIAGLNKQIFDLETQQLVEV